MLFTLSPSAMPAGYGEALLPLDALKAHLGVFADDDFELIAALRDVAIDAVEQYAQLRLARRTDMLITFDRFDPRMRLSVGPTASLQVTAIDYVDANGAAQSIADGVWRVAPDARLLPAIGTSWPAGATDVAVTFSAGFESGACPPGLIHAAKMFAAHLYANREAVTYSGLSVSAAEVPYGFAMLCDQYRMTRI